MPTITQLEPEQCQRSRDNAQLWARIRRGAGTHFHGDDVEVRTSVIYGVPAVIPSASTDPEGWLRVEDALRNAARRAARSVHFTKTTPMTKTLNKSVALTYADMQAQ